MRDYLAAYEAAPYRGPEPHGRPPLVLAALRPRMLALAATATDGAFPYLVPESYVRAPAPDWTKQPQRQAGHGRCWSSACRSCV